MTADNTKEEVTKMRQVIISAAALLVILILVICASAALARAPSAGFDDEAKPPTMPSITWPAVLVEPDAGTDVDAAEVVADPAAEVEADPVGSLQLLVSAIKAGQWRFVVALLIAFVMFFSSKIWPVREKFEWFKGDRGGAILVMLLSLGAAVSAALASSAALDWKLFVGAIGVCWTAVGGVQWLKRLIWPKDSADADAAG